eukprot:scaffold149_cov315-Pinguiococcus_pyrenoidosus.AAC.105
MAKRALVLSSHSVCSSSFDIRYKLRLRAGSTASVTVDVELRPLRYPKASGSACCLCLSASRDTRDLVRSSKPPATIIKHIGGAPYPKCFAVAPHQ